MTAILTTSTGALRIEFAGVLEAEDPTPTVCINGGECDGCIDNERCNGKDGE